MDLQARWRSLKMKNGGELIKGEEEEMLGGGWVLIGLGFIFGFN